MGNLFTFRLILQMILVYIWNEYEIFVFWHECITIFMYLSLLSWLVGAVSQRSFRVSCSAAKVLFYTHAMCGGTILVCVLDFHF